MNLLSQYLTIDTVRLDIDVVSRKRLFEEASFAIETAYGEDHDTVFEALMARERLGSTALGHGCAVPHGRLESLQEPALVLLRTKQPIAYDAPDDKPVRLFMTLLVPPRQSRRTPADPSRNCGTLRRRRRARRPPQHDGSRGGVRTHRKLEFSFCRATRCYERSRGLILPTASRKAFC